MISFGANMELTSTLSNWSKWHLCIQVTSVVYTSHHHPHPQTKETVIKHCWVGPNKKTNNIEKTKEQRLKESWLCFFAFCFSVQVQLLSLDTFWWFWFSRVFCLRQTQGSFGLLWFPRDFDDACDPFHVYCTHVATTTLQNKIKKLMRLQMWCYCNPKWTYKTQEQ